MACPDFNEFAKFILEFDQAVEINRQKDKPLRYNVWETTPDHVKNLTSKLRTDVLPDNTQSLRILTKLNNALRRIQENSNKGGTVQKDIFDNQYSIEMSIALHELMESVKGESDKARNLDVEITSISDTGVLPALPLSRVAASIGRKIAYQKGYRFKRATSEDSARSIETLYYDVGREAIRLLEQQGYVKTHDNVPTIMDYQNKGDLKKDFPKNDKTRSDVLSVSLDEKKLGINAETQEANYFLDRSSADLTDTNLGVVTEKLRAVNMITQPATITLPDTKANQSDEELKQWDEGVRNLDPTTERVRKSLYKQPLRINSALEDFIKLLSEEQQNSGKSASKRINEIFGNRQNMVRSLFGLKRSDDFSIDKRESVSGQNLSKTTPLDDLVEYYDLIQDSDLHMPMKVGRNARLYYLNSVLNAHGSKQSRAMLTPGEYTVDTDSADYDFLVYQLGEALGGRYDYQQIVSGTELQPALDAYESFRTAGTLRAKMRALAGLARQFEGVDYVTLTTALQGVQDVRNAKKGKVTTQFAVSSDATASGGTLTFLQALGTNPRVTEFLQRIGLLKPDTLVERDLDDLYQLMSNAVRAHLKGEGPGLGPDLGEADPTNLLEYTLDLLFNGGKDIREFSKDPTMTFVYGQGRTGAVETMSRSLADRVIDNLDDPKTREFLARLMDDNAYMEQEGAQLKDLKGLYKNIVSRLKESGLPGTMYDIMEDSLKNEYLSQYTDRSQKVYDLVKKLPADTPFKILPAGAVLANVPVTRENLNTYGMPVTKEVEVLNKLEGVDDTVLTRREKLQKTVMDVSTIHGIDSALLYHSLGDVKPNDGVVVIHDDVRGSVQTVRAMEDAYAKKAVDVTSKYDVHQQIMNAIKVYDPELAKSADFKALDQEINEAVSEKKRIMKELFNPETNALIGDRDAVAAFKSGPEVDTAEETTVQSSIPAGTPLADQDFGDATVTLSEGGTTVEVLAQEYWNDIQSRLKMVESLRTCLTS